MKCVQAIILASICFLSLQGQQTVSSTGGNAMVGGCRACYTVGQVVYSTNIRLRVIISIYELSALFDLLFFMNFKLIKSF